MSEISFFSNNIEFSISNEDELCEWLDSIAKTDSKQIESLNIVFMSDDELLKMNKKYLSHDFFTDIITFPDEAAEVGGEMYISVDRVSENARELGIHFIDELHRVIAHGLLHLLNYNDKSEEQQKEMRSREEICLNLRRFNVPRETK